MEKEHLPQPLTLVGCDLASAEMRYIVTLKGEEKNRRSDRGVSVILY